MRCTENPVTVSPHYEVCYFDDRWNINITILHLQNAKSAESARLGGGRHWTKPGRQAVQGRSATIIILMHQAESGQQQTVATGED